jgi:hypothetical protein
VPEDYPTVLAGVDAAAAGDSVLVGPGTWTDRDARVVPIGLTIESAMFLRPGITVIGTAGPEQTVIDPGEPGMWFMNAVGYYVDGPDPARLVGLTLTSGQTGVGAVECGSLELHGCHLVDCGGRGIGSRDAEILVEGCLVAGNEFDSEPQLREGAVSVRDVHLVVRNSRFEGNASSAIRSVDFQGGSSLSVEDSEFIENGVRALLSLINGPLLVERCLFLRNTGGGVGVSESDGAIRFCTFAYDTSAGSGGGIGTSMSDVVIESNTFYRCHAFNFGSAINRANEDGGTRNNIAYGCTGPNGPFYLTSSATPHPTTGCNLFFANEGSGYAGNWSAGPTDVFADPEFCDEVNLDLRLRSTSPAAPANNPCGLVGAWEVGCGPVSVERKSWGKIKGAYRVQEGR